MDLGARVLDSYDQTWTQLRDRLADLDDREYLWEPVANCWTVRDTAEGTQADWADPDPIPAPVTTIAWRMWHIAVDSLETYSRRVFGCRVPATPAEVGCVRQMVRGRCFDRLSKLSGRAWGDSTPLRPAARCFLG
jgi:hypothetical protein